MECCCAGEPELGRGDCAACCEPVSSDSASVTTASRLDCDGTQCTSDGNVSRPAASTQGWRMGCVTDNPGRLYNRPVVKVVSCVMHCHFVPKRIIRAYRTAGQQGEGQQR